MNREKETNKRRIRKENGWEEDFHSDSELYYPGEVGIGNTGNENIEFEVQKGYLFLQFVI